MKKMQLYTNQGCLMESDLKSRKYGYGKYNGYNNYTDNSYVDGNAYDNTYAYDNNYDNTYGNTYGNAYGNVHNKKENVKTKEKIKTKKKTSSKFKRRMILLAAAATCFFGMKYIKPFFVNETKIECQAVTQTKKYYCGPASVKATLGAINNASESQDNYANELGTTEDGTTATNIPTVLNNNQDKWNYTLSTGNTSYNTFVRGIKRAVSNGCPVIVDINTSKCSQQEQENVWGYSVTGHYITVVGYDFSNGQELVYVHDSHYKNPASYKEMKCKTLFNANQNHANQPVIW